LTSYRESDIFASASRTRQTGSRSAGRVLDYEACRQEEDEVRRFVVDRDASTSYEYLVSKLQHVFPQLKVSSFSVSWTDGDGDKVTIATDEELIIALTEMTGPLYKLTVNLKKVKKAAQVFEEEKDASATEKVVHYGVTCDGCDMKPIVGNR